MGRALPRRSASSERPASEASSRFPSRHLAPRFSLDGRPPLYPPATTSSVSSVSSVSSSSFAVPTSNRTAPA